MKVDRVFYGICFGKPKQRMVAIGNGQSEPRELLPHRSRQVKDYRPTFNWGSMDTGSHQLSLAILLQVSNDAQVALKYHREFVREVIAQIKSSHSDWELVESDIRRWIDRQWQKSCV